MPQPLPLTSERLERHGLFLIEDGQTIFLWVGRDAVPQLIQDVFNLPSYEVLRGGKVCYLSQFAYVARIFLSLTSSSDDVAIARQPILAAGERRHPKDARDAARGLPPASVRRQRGRRAAIAPLGSQLPHPGPCGRAAKLPTVHLAVARQGMSHRLCLVARVDRC